VLDVATSRAGELLNAKHCSVYIRDREQAELKLVASLDVDLIGLRIKEGEGLAGRVIVSGHSLAIDDYARWEGRAPLFDDKNFGPSAGTPLKWQNTVIGAFSLSRVKGAERFTNADLDFLEQIAGEVAIAIHQTTLFEEVQEGQRRLQVLSHRLIDAQEDERKRLARELHDQIGQALTAVQISLQTLQSANNNGSEKLIEDSLAIIDEAIEQVHDLSLDLRPSLLDEVGLVAALRWYVGRVASRAGLEHGFKAYDLDTRLAPEVETACFRIAQEALTNVLRHAAATNVSVEIASSDSDLHLLVQDNGVGFDVRSALSRTGLGASLGLQGMQERAAAIGGSLDITSNLRRGTKVQATLLKRPQSQCNEQG
jgi:signal transduction histidine kinase